MTMQFGFQAALHDAAASLSISQDGPYLIIEEVDAPPSTVSLVAGIAFAMCFVAFGLFVASWEMDPASEPLRFPVAALFVIVGLVLMWRLISRKKTIRRIVANCETQMIEFGHMIAGEGNTWQYQKKGAFDYSQVQSFNTGYVDHTEPGAEQSCTGLYVKVPDGPRGGLLVIGALYEIEIAIDHIYRHMSNAPHGDSYFHDKSSRLPRSFRLKNGEDR